MIGTAGLLGAIGIVVITYTAATRSAEQYLRDRPADDPGDRPQWQFMHSLVPILIGYTIAHYFSLMVFQGQMGYILASDPFDQGWNLLGAADWKMNLTLVSTSAIASSRSAPSSPGTSWGSSPPTTAPWPCSRAATSLRGQYRCSR